MNNQHYLIKRQPTQPSTIAIRMSQSFTKNCNRACLFANAFLPTLKTNFFGNDSTPIKDEINSNGLINK